MLAWVVLFAPAMIIPASVRADTAPAVKGPLPPEKEEWIQIETAHFTIFSNAPERRTLELGRSLERFRAVLSAFQTDLRIDPPQPYFIYIFRNQESFNAYNLRQNGKVAAISGLFHPGWDANYILMSAAWNDDPRPTIYHEFTHQFIGNNLVAIPAWFNEGLAEYYSTFVGDDKRASLGLPVEAHVQWLSYNTFIPLKQLFDQQYNPDFYTEVTRGGTFYAESWALVHYLLANGAERRAQAGRFMDGMSDGLSVEASLEASFHWPMDKLQQEVQAYVARGRFNYSQVTFTDHFHVDDRAKVRPMSRGEALGRLGDLLLHLQEERRADAEAHLKEALRLEPQNGIALMNTGALAASKGEFEEAIRLYEKAAVTRRDDPLLNYRQARALLHRKDWEREVGDHAGDSIPGETLTRARELLSRAIQSKPTFAEAYIELGNLASSAGGNLQEGIEALEKARTLLPARLDVTMSLFYLYTEAGKREKAQALYEKAIVPTRDETSIRWARLRLETYDRIHAPQSAEGGDQTGSLYSAPAPQDSSAPADEKAFEQRKRSYIEMLENALKSTTDPESRKRLEAEIARAKASANYPAQVDAFNQAVKLANARDHRGAIAILEKLLPEVQEPELHTRVQQMLGDLKKRVAK